VIADDPDYRELPVSKHVRVYLECVRSACALVSAIGTMLVLLRVFKVI
jgi:hypothetical protein